MKSKKQREAEELQKAHDDAFGAPKYVVIYTSTSLPYSGNRWVHYTGKTQAYRYHTLFDSAEEAARFASETKHARIFGLNPEYTAKVTVEMVVKE